ncbi:MAG: tetratricopeptide repeat protein [Spirochaetaceae bacterium]|jgi:Flp pilus assembly protein TadD|nr:tetratricopeptide repeat protein [Spirochaetaceae bacterium]
MSNNTLGAKLLLVFAFTVLASAGINAQIHNKDYYYERSRWRSSTGDNAGALEDLNLVISLDSTDPQAYNARGVIYEKCGDYNAARLDYEHALRLNPDSAEARHNINNLNEKLGGVNLANVGTALVYGHAQSTHARQVTTYAPVQHVQQHSYTPALSVQQEGYIPVQSVYQKGYTTVQPVQQESYTPIRSVQQMTYTPAQSTRQQIYTQARPVRQVVYGSQFATHTDFLNTSVVNYNRPGVNIGLFRQTGTPMVSGYGNVLQPAALRTGSGDYGQTAYRASTRKQFIDAAAENNNNYGVTLNSSGRFEEAISKFTEAIAIYPEYAIAYNNRGVAYASIGDFVRATEDFIKALRINPYYYDAQSNYTRINGNTSVVAVTQ